MSRRVAFFVHHFNPWGGHDQSNLEIARRLIRVRDFLLYTFKIDDPFQKENLNTVASQKKAIRLLRPLVMKPAILGEIIFWIASGSRLLFEFGFRYRKKVLTMSPGTACLASEIVQVQFINTSWKNLLKQHPSLAVKSSPFKRFYHSSLLRLHSLVERRIYKPDKIYIALSQAEAQELTRHFHVKNVRVIPHGVDSVRFHPRGENSDEVREFRARAGLEDHHVALLFVGAFERKGLPTLIQALGSLPEDLLKITRLLVVGKGARAEMEALARHFNVGHALLFLGSSSCVEKIYQACEIFVLPTYYEPFGLVIFEAMASGLPVIVPKSAGAAEWITNDSGRLLDSPWNPAEIAGALEELISNSALRAKLGQEARKIAQSRSWDRVAGEYLDLIDYAMEHSK